MRHGICERQRRLQRVSHAAEQATVLCGSAAGQDWKVSGGRSPDAVRLVFWGTASGGRDWRLPQSVLHQQHIGEKRNRRSHDAGAAFAATLNDERDYDDRHRPEADREENRHAGAGRQNVVPISQRADPGPRSPGEDGGMWEGAWENDALRTFGRNRHS